MLWHLEELALWHGTVFGSSSVAELSGCCLWARGVTERSGVTPAASRPRAGIAWDWLCKVVRVNVFEAVL